MEEGWSGVWIGHVQRCRVCILAENSILQEPCVRPLWYISACIYLYQFSAYEIKTIHNQEPAPKEILENLTAKGGDLLKRTVENFQRTPTGNSRHGQDSDASGEEAKTPEDDRMELDEPGSGGRTTRGRHKRNYLHYFGLELTGMQGLRQAPPQRVLFQPDVTSSRQTRHPSSHLQSPQPTGTPNSTYNYSNTSSATQLPTQIERYEPRPPMPLTLRGVTTPGNNPHLFKEQQRLVRDRKLALMGRAPIQNTKGMMKPGRKSNK